jgi:mannose-6-phosphate isomerase-like protein (cupin superfamily)
MMTLKLRRVVTGHDKNGKAIVHIDEIAKNVLTSRPGQAGVVVWSTEGHPIDNTDDYDGSQRKLGTSLSNGTVFRVVKYDPGVSPRSHRTDSIDYAAVMSGEIEMDIDGTIVHLKAGDVLVQRGTIHNWINRGTVPCIIAFTLIGAKPAAVGGKTLHETG